MTHKSELGKRGEDVAEDFLKENGHRIVGRNVREKFSELDIVSIAPDKTLVFIEVKTMMVGDIIPEDQMTNAKIHKFKKIAEYYAGAHPELIKENKGWRLDVIAITFLEGSSYKINHYENII